MKEKYYNINKSFSREEDNVEAKVVNPEISFEESNSRNLKRFELLHNVNTFRTGFAQTAYQNNDMLTSTTIDNKLTKTYNENDKLDSLCISLNKPEDFSILETVSFPKKPMRKKNFLSSIDSVLNSSSNKKEKVKKIMGDLVYNPERLNTETSYSDNKRIKEEDNKNFYENMISHRKEDPLSSRDYETKNLLTEQTHNKRDLSATKRGQISILKGKLFNNQKGNLSSRSNSPDFEGHSKILNTITVNKTSYVNKYKNTLVTPYKARSLEKDKKKNMVKPYYENRVLVKKNNKDKSGVSKKASENKKNISKKSSKHSLKNKMEVLKENRGKRSTGKDRSSRSPQNIYTINKDISNKNTIDSQRSDKREEFLNLSSK